LQDLLSCLGAQRDRQDKAKWHTEQGPVSITGSKFFNWHQQVGGGGAIDLVMHLAGIDCCAAVAWLEQHCPGHVPLANGLSHGPLANKLRLPVPNDRMLGRVREYLIGRRQLSPAIIEPLIESGKLYADSRGNSVFLLVTGKANRPVGAELRGTGLQVWRGMAPGTRKDEGYFWIGGQGSQEIVLCESAIDAISCFQLHLQRICISTSGVRADPRWLAGLLARGYQIRCGFDADGPGDAAARQMIALHPKVKRLRPPAHDWNDALAPGY
jgi:protein strawberry notch